MCNSIQALQYIARFDPLQICNALRRYIGIYPAIKRLSYHNTIKYIPVKEIEAQFVQCAKCTMCTLMQRFLQSRLQSIIPNVSLGCTWHAALDVQGCEKLLNIETICC